MLEKNWLESALLAKEKAEDGKIEEAIALYEDSIKNNPNEAWPYIKLADLYEKKFEHKKAITLLEISTEIEPENPWGHIFLVKLLKQENRLKEALERCELGLEINPENEKLELLLSEISSLLPEETTTENWLESALLAKEKAEDGKIEEAIALYEDSIKNNPNEAWPYIKLADLYEKKFEHKKAIALLENATEIEPENPWGHIFLVKLLKQENRLKEALEKCELGLEINPENEKLELLLSEIKGLLEGEKPTENWQKSALLAKEKAEDGKIEEAIGLYEDSIKNNPDEAWPYIKLADLYEKKFEHKKAIALLENATEIEPENPWYYYSLGNLYLKKKDYKKAMINLVKSGKYEQQQKIPNLKRKIIMAFQNCGLFSSYIEESISCDIIKSYFSLREIDNDQEKQIEFFNKQNIATNCEFVFDRYPNIKSLNKYKIKNYAQYRQWMLSFANSLITFCSLKRKTNLLDINGSFGFTTIPLISYLNSEAKICCVDTDTESYNWFSENIQYKYSNVSSLLVNDFSVNNLATKITQSNSDFDIIIATDLMDRLDFENDYNSLLEIIIFFVKILQPNGLIILSGKIIDEEFWSLKYDQDNKVNNSFFPGINFEINTKVYTKQYSPSSFFKGYCRFELETMFYELDLKVHKFKKGTWLNNWRKEKHLSPFVNDFYILRK